MATFRIPSWIGERWHALICFVIRSIFQTTWRPTPQDPWNPWLMVPDLRWHTTLPMDALARRGLSYAKVVCKWPHDFGKVWYKVVHQYTKLFSFEEWLPVSSWSKTLAGGLQAIHIDTCNCKDFQYVGWMWQLNGHLSPCAEVDCFNRWDANSVRDFRGWTRQSAMVQTW